jgi:phosphoenolpyruvate-protein phosphotransferase (PTS system enzyme I)
MEVIKGIPVSPGVVIGRAFLLEDGRERVPYHAVRAADVDREMAHFEKALVAAIADLKRDRDRAAEKLGPEPAKIFEFHLGLLHDTTLLAPIRERITKEHVTAAYAVSEAFRDLADRFRAMGSEVFRQKASDVIDLDRRLLSKLVGQSRDRLARITEPVIVIAHDLTATQAASIDASKVIGYAADAGGRTSHGSIVAAALGIPIIVGCQRISRSVNDGDEIIIDGKSGVVIVQPDAETLAAYQRDVERLIGFQADLRELAVLESITQDGVRIKLMGNIEFAHEIDTLLSVGGEGVGLYRTEFLVLANRTSAMPTEDEHYEAYRACVENLNGRPLTIRTLDLGADKETQERTEEPERNPFLGLRSIRYTLQNLPLFKTQLRAILRTTAIAPPGAVKIMFPLVSTYSELKQAKMILHDVMEECQEEGIEFKSDIPVGIMIEVPSAALMASTFAREVSFFSIGTNDLIQYTLAVDRGNERVANLYSGAHPAVLQLIKNVIRVARRFHVETSICGEIAGDPTYTMLLIGLGLRTLSLVPSQIPHVKRIVRSVDVTTCERLARKVGSFDSERQVLNCLREELQKTLPESDGGWSAG